MQDQILTELEKLRNVDPEAFAKAVLLSSSYSCINVSDKENIEIAETIQSRYKISFSFSADDFLYVTITEDFDYEQVINDYDNNVIVPDDLTLESYLGLY